MTTRATPATFDREVERRAVYEAVLREYLDNTVERLVIDPGTKQMWGSEILAAPARLHADTKDDYASRPPGTVPIGLDVGRPIVWFSGTDWEALQPDFEARGTYEMDAKWRVFHRMHPGSAGSMNLSDVGFSDDRRQALVHVWSGTSSLGFAGFFFLLEKSKGRWVIREKTMTVVS